MTGSARTSQRAATPSHISLEPSLCVPQPSSTTSTPSLDAATPRSYHCSPTSIDRLGAIHVAASSDTYFANWESSPHLHDANDVQSPDSADTSPRRYRFESTSAISSTTPLRQAASAAASPLFPPLDQPHIMSPLPAHMVQPGAPVLSSLSTPNFTPAHTPAPLFYPGSASLASSSQSRTPSVKGSLPLPGEPDNIPPEHSTTSLFPQSAVRSDSANSISSILNDCGHQSYANASPDVSPPLTTHNLEQYNDSVQETAPPVPAKHTSDPPLIPYARPPQLAQVAAAHAQMVERPISPFSPTQATYQKMIASPTRIDTPDLNRDLIDFDSDRESLSDLRAYVQGARGSVSQLSGYPAQYASYDDQAKSESEEDENDLDRNPLYEILSTTSSPYVRKAWETSKLILVPPRRAIAPAFLASDKADTSSSIGHGDMELNNSREWEIYAALHAMRQQIGSPDSYVSCSRSFDGRNLLARVDVMNGLVEITLEEEAKHPPLQQHSNLRRSLAGPPLIRTDTMTTTSSSTAAHAIAPHLMLSSSPTSSAESSIFPVTPPVSPPFKPTASMRSVKEQKLDSVAFPSMEPLIPLPTEQPATSRRIQIIKETPIYRRRRPPRQHSSHSISSTSAPSALPQQLSLAESSTSVSIRELNHKLSNVSLNAVPTKTVKKRDSKVRLRVPRWLKGGSKENLKAVESAPATPANAQTKFGHNQMNSLSSRHATIQEDSQPVVEKLRVIQIDDYLIEWPGKDQAPTVQQSVTGRKSTHFAESTYSSEGIAQTLRSSVSSAAPSRQNSSAARSHRRSPSLLRHRTSNASTMSQMLAWSAARDFSSDIAYLLDPPLYLSHMAIPLETALREIIRLSRDFSRGLNYIRGCEDILAQRLRRNLVDTVWLSLQLLDMSNQQKDKLYDMLENVTMAFMHERIFDASIKVIYEAEDAAFNNVVRTYRAASISVTDFTLSSNMPEASFQHATAILAQLSGTENAQPELWERMSPQSYKRLVQLISETTDSASTVIAILEAKTPLDCASSLRRVIDELVKASEQEAQSDSRHSLATDDLIALLGWCMVKAGVQNLSSLIFYTRHFRLSSSTAADVEWALVQFEAAMAFLRTDPLGLLSFSEMSSGAVTPSHSPVRPLYSRRGSEDSVLGFSSRSRRASVQSLSAVDLMRTRSRSPNTVTHQHTHHRTLSSLPAVRPVVYQAVGENSRTSISSTVMTEEEEDNAEMGPPSMPLQRPNRSKSNDISQVRPDNLVAHARYKSASNRPPVVLRPQAVRPAPRSFHFADDGEQKEQGHPTRLFLNRSQTTPYNVSSREIPSVRVSVDLQRSGSDSTRTPSNEWWGPLRQRLAAPISPPPLGGSDASSSIRADSPAKTHSERGSFDLDRSTSDIGWLEWGRKRLSSMTSSTSLLPDPSDAAQKSYAEQIADKIAHSQSQTLPTQTRPRRKSESAANALSSPALQCEDPTSDGASESSSNAGGSVAGSSNAGFSGRSISQAMRPRSTLSLSSMTSSADGDSGGSQGHLTASGMTRSSTQASFRHSVSGSSNLARSRRFRKELLSANIAPPQLHLDTATPLITTGPCTSPHDPRPSPRYNDGFGNAVSTGMTFNNPYNLSHSSSRFGSTPFSPIQEVSSFSTPSPDAGATSPYHFGNDYTQQDEEHADGADTHAPPTPRDASSFPRSTLPPSLTSTTITAL